MLFSYTSELTIDENSCLGASFSLKQMVPSFLDWKDIASTVAKDFEGYICVLLTSNTKHCNRILNYIHENWSSIDEATGRNILLFVSSPAPDEYLFTIDDKHILNKIPDIKNRNAKAIWKTLIGKPEHELFYWSKEMSYKLGFEFIDELPIPSIAALKFEFEDKDSESAFINGRSFALPLSNKVEDIKVIIKNIGALATKSSKNYLDSYNHFCNSIQYHPIHGLGIRNAYRKTSQFLANILSIKEKIKNLSSF